jgi:single-stranded-DNA-specific exonuclease
MLTDKSWSLKNYTVEDSLILKNQMNISAITAGLLYQRGIKTREEAEKFLFGTLDDIKGPWTLRGMKQAVQRIEKAVQNKEKIIIFGDYDVDGVCSIVILKECIEMLGGVADYYVPDRFEEGYGLNMQAVSILLEQQYKLLISVDCGIASVEEARFAAAGGMDIIITDHHTPGEILPQAVAVINPKLDMEEDNYHLCGAGVAYKLALALQQHIMRKQDHSKWLDLVALATVADVVPLLGDNHILVKYGLKVMENTTRTGLKALLKEVELDNRSLTSWQIGFVIAPRLNAAGRLDSARQSVELLCTNNHKKAADIASYMNKLNNERRQIEETIYEQALNNIWDLNLHENNVIVVAGDNWHQGVIGIVASRICEKFYRPAIVISWDGNTGKGSGRSIKGFNLYNALKSCKEHLEQFGGHQMAAGLAIDRHELERFTSALNQYSKFIADGDIMHKTIQADGEILFDDINNDFIAELKSLEPYGEGNPQPGFILRNIMIHSLLPVGSQKEHVRFDFRRNDLQGIAFRKAEYLNFPYKECYHDLICELDENEFRGQKKVQIKVKDMKTSFIPDNLKKFDGLDTGSYQQVKRIISEITADRPILILFPTVRCLVKYKPALSHFIRSNFLYDLHGLQDQTINSAAAADLLKGRAGVYLMTVAYFDSFIHHTQLPDSMQYILPVWPWEAPENRKNGTYITEKIFFNYSKDDILQAVHKGWTYDKNKRTLIYSNRKTTVARLTKEIPDLVMEAAIEQTNKRRYYRRKFERMGAGVFLTDGNYSFGLPFNNIDEIFMADCPFSIWETVFLADQLTAGSKLEIRIPVSREQFEQNSSFLNKRYPDEPEVIKVIDYFKHLSSKTLTGDADSILQMINEWQGRSMSKLELFSIMQILIDLNLCQIRKKGNMMEIMNYAKESPAINLFESLAFREGVAEKEAWSDLTRSLNYNTNW